MSWFNKFFGNREDDYEIVSSNVPMTTLLRWYLYDTAISDNINSLAEQLGLNRVSEEGDTKEHEDSKTRVERVMPLFPFLEMVSNFSADALSQLHSKEMKDHDPERAAEIEEDYDSMYAVYKAVALSTLIGGFSIALDLGMIHTNAVNSEFIDMEIYDDE